MNNKTAILKIILLIIGVISLLWFNQTYLHVAPNEIREWILSFGWIAPLVYIFLYTIRPLILFPASILSLAGGLAFGALWGTVFTVVGATAGAALSFLLARYMGRNIARKEWKGNWKKVQRQLVERGFFYVLLLRLIPLFPFDFISYLSGVSKIRFRAFLYGTLFGIIPGTFAYNFLGSSLTKGSVKDIAIAALVFLVVLIVPLIVKKFFLKDV